MCSALHPEQVGQPALPGAVGTAGRPHPPDRCDGELAGAGGGDPRDGQLRRAGAASGVPRSAIGGGRHRPGGRTREVEGSRVDAVRVGAGCAGRTSADSGAPRADGGRRTRLHGAARSCAGGRVAPIGSRQGQWPGDRALRTSPVRRPQPTMPWPRRSSWPAPPPSRPPATRRSSGTTGRGARARGAGDRRGRARGARRRPHAHLRQPAARLRRLALGGDPRPLPRRGRGDRRRGRAAARRAGAARARVGAVARAAAPRRPLRRRRAALHRGRPPAGAVLRGRRRLRRGPRGQRRRLRGRRWAASG